MSRTAIVTLCLLCATLGHAQGIAIRGERMVVGRDALVSIHGDLFDDGTIVNQGRIVVDGVIHTATAAACANSGTITFVADTSMWLNAAPLNDIVNMGTIEITGSEHLFTDASGDADGATAMGRDTLSRIGGLVRFVRGAGLQRIQRRHYTDLALGGAATKQILDGTAVAGSYEAAGGARRYEGWFIFDGNRPQTLTPEYGQVSGIDRYRHLLLRNGPKRLAQGDSTIVEQILRIESRAPTIIQGRMTWGSEARVAANLRIEDGGHVTTADSTWFTDTVDVVDGRLLMRPTSTTVVDTSALLRLYDAASSLLHVGDTAELRIRGVYVNAFGQHANATYAATSLVNYEGRQPQTILAAGPAAAYGSLRAAQGGKTVDGNVHLQRDLYVHSAMIDAGADTVAMRDGVADYSGVSEVIGAMRRDLRTAAAGTTFAYNNAQTLLTFDSTPTILTLDVRPKTDPVVYDASTDVRRKVTLSALGDWRATIRIGYTIEDLPSAWATSTSQHLLRFMRATDRPQQLATKLVPTLPPSYARRAAAADVMGYVELKGLGSTGPDNMVIPSGYDVLLRGSRDVLQAIAHGRWSNPMTWDEGREPEPQDAVMINGYTVHVGYERATDSYRIAELFPTQMASSVEIGDQPNSALLVGSDAAAYAFSLVPAPTSVVRVQRRATSPVDVAEQDISNRPIDGGLVVYPSAEFSTPRLLVSPGATVTNAGILSVGLP
ncbi:MAG: hypothetical protein FGM24_02605 [Candidatus Kapabacteria bacterium]|nr:hypothetical protein [Candidatus Kapabacteria bacterium]